MNILTKRGALDNIVTYEHVCDTKADIASIPKELITLGSIAIVIEDESEGGGLEAYIANSHKEWFPLVGGGESGGTSGVSAHICTSNEYNSNTRVPTVQNPEEGTFYLVPVSNVTDSGNVFDEWIYVADADKWEKFGSGGSVVASTQADWEESDSSEASYVQNKPTVYAGEGLYAVVIGSNEKAHATNQGSVAEGSSTATALYAHAEGSGTIASGANAHSEGFSTHATAQSAHAEGDYTYATDMGAHAEGGNTNATGVRSHAEGDGTHATDRATHSEGTSTYATGGSSHAEGYGTTASGGSSHAEGSSTTASGHNGSHAEGDGTIASGRGAHAEGYYTIAAGEYQHVSGKSNIAEVIPPNWASDTAYNYGDFVIYGGNRYKCIGENGVQSTTFPSSDTTNWEKTEFNCDYSEIIGGGTGNNNRKNIRTLDWYGNEVLAGSLTANNIHVKNSYLGENYTLLYDATVDLSEQQNDNFIRTPSGTQLSLINNYTFKQNTVYRITIGDEVFICDSFKISTPGGTTINLSSREKMSSNGTTTRFQLNTNFSTSSDSTAPFNKISSIFWNNNQPDSYHLTIEEISEVITTNSVIANNDITIGSTTITESQLQALLAMLS